MNAAQSNVRVVRAIPAYEANTVSARSTDADSHVSHVAHTPQVRLQYIDVIRGICCISMVVFHACFIAQELFGVPLDWFSGVLQQLWRAHIAWSFLFIAGMMCAFTHHMYKRIACYGVTAALIWLVSSSPYEIYLSAMALSFACVHLPYLLLSYRRVLCALRTTDGLQCLFAHLCLLFTCPKACLARADLRFRSLPSSIQLTALRF